ncbi:hypothetical protein V6N11_044345 [Hibiscus sabdariffa]|uniref:Uncharacterized protein n=1 Tax=Hibiscus sabdariffa TaxID=183260 RepID=A0ABR2RFM5_9ROSI
MGILKIRAVGFSRKSYQISDLAGFFRKVGLEGFSVMRIAGSSILLMFDEEGQQIEEAIGPKCDCVCELVGDFQDASKSVSDGEEEERRHASVLEGRNGVSNSAETIVPNSIMSKTMNSIEMNRMWEGNKRVDWQVLEHDSGIAEEYIGMIQRDNEETNVGSPMGSGPKGRAKLSDVIEIGGEQHKVRQLSAILMSEVPPKDRTVPTKGVAKHGRVDALEQLDTKKGGGELDDNDLLHKLDLVSKLWKVS